MNNLLVLAHQGFRVLVVHSPDGSDNRWSIFEMRFKVRAHVASVGSIGAITPVPVPRMFIEQLMDRSGCVCMGGMVYGVGRMILGR